MVHLTKSNLHHAVKHATAKYDTLKRKIADARLQEHGKRVTNQLVRTVEVTGAAFLTGVVQGRTGGLTIMGVPAELLAGSVLAGAALLNAAGDASHHLAAFGDGVLAAYGVTTGRGVGVTMRSKALGAAGTSGGTPQVSGSAPAGLGAGREPHLTPDEVAALARVED